MTDYKIKIEIERLLKMGITEARVVTYANAGRIEEVQYIIDQMAEELDLISNELCNFVPFQTTILTDDSDSGDDCKVEKCVLKG